MGQPGRVFGRPEIELAGAGNRRALNLWRRIVFVIGQQVVNITGSVAVGGGDVDGAVVCGIVVVDEGDVGNGSGAIEVIGDGDAGERLHAGVVSWPVAGGGRAVGLVEEQVGGKIALRQIGDVQRAEGGVVGQQLVQRQLRLIGIPTAREVHEVADTFAENGFLLAGGNAGLPVAVKHEGVGIVGWPGGNPLAQ